MEQVTRFSETNAYEIATYVQVRSFPNSSQLVRRETFSLDFAWCTLHTCVRYFEYSVQNRF